MKALLFPGQGSQIVGMGKEFFENFSSVKEIFSIADEKLKFNISKIILEGPSDELKLTKNTQPAILTVSCAILDVMIKEFNFKIEDIKYFAGHSLGEYSALVNSKSLNFTDAIYLLHERGRFMQEAVPIGKGGMLAILNMSLEEINNYISNLKKKDVCEIANDNADGQIIVSGDIQSILNLQEILKKDKKKSILLPVSAPFHCSLMQSAAENMKKIINEISFMKPKNEIISNVTAQPVIDPPQIKELLYKQIYSKVRWRESISYMANNGINEYIEIGPGKVLTGLVKRIVKNVSLTSINSIEEIKDYLK